MPAKATITLDNKSRRSRRPKAPKGYRRVRPGVNAKIKKSGPRKNRVAKLRRNKKAQRTTKRGVKLTSMGDKMKALEHVEIPNVSSSSPTTSSVDKNGLMNFIEKFIAHISCCFPDFCRVYGYNQQDLEFYAIQLYYTHMTRVGSLTGPTLVGVEISDSTLAVPIGFAKYLEALGPYSENGVTARKTDVAITNYTPAWIGTGVINNATYPTGTPETGGNWRDVAVHPNWAFGPVYTTVPNHFSQISFGGAVTNFTNWLAGGRGVAISGRLTHIGGTVQLGKIAQVAADGSAYAYKESANGTSYVSQFKKWDVEMAIAINPSIIPGNIASFTSKPIPNPHFDYRVSYGTAGANKTNYAPHNQIAAMCIFLGQHSKQYLPGPAHSTLDFRGTKLHTFFPRVNNSPLIGIQEALKKHYDSVITTMPVGSPLDPQSQKYLAFATMTAFCLQQRLQSCEVNHINVPASRISGQGATYPYNATVTAQTVGYLPQAIVCDAAWKNVPLPAVIAQAIDAVGIVIDDHVMSIPYVNYQYTSTTMGSNATPLGAAYTVTTGIGPMWYSGSGYVEFYDKQFTLPNPFTLPVGQYPQPSSDSAGTLTQPLLTWTTPQGAEVLVSAANTHDFFAFATDNAVTYGLFTLNGPWIAAIESLWVGFVSQNLSVNQPQTVTVTNDVAGRATYGRTISSLSANSTIANSFWPSSVDDQTFANIKLLASIDSSVAVIYAANMMNASEADEAMTIAANLTSVQPAAPPQYHTRYLNSKWVAIKGLAQQDGDDIPIAGPYSVDCPTDSLAAHTAAKVTATYGPNSAFNSQISQYTGKGFSFKPRYNFKGISDNVRQSFSKITAEFNGQLSQNLFAQQVPSTPEPSSLGGPLGRAATYANASTLQFINSRVGLHTQDKSPDVVTSSPKKHDTWSRFKGVVSKGVQITGKALNIAQDVKKGGEAVEAAL